MIRTRVGYAGGEKLNPTYYDLGDHSETVQVDYDPARTSYQQLLSVFWQSHDATAQSWSRQYMSLIFYHNEEQKQLAEASLAQEEARLGKNILTEIVPYREFYLAEGYHQKYYLQNEMQLALEYELIYPSPRDFINSTAVARVNGYVAGNGSLEQLERELASLGLSKKGEESLLKMFRALESKGLNWCPVPLPQS